MPVSGYQKRSKDERLDTEKADEYGPEIVPFYGRR